MVDRTRPCIHSQVDAIAMLHCALGKRRWIDGSRRDLFALPGIQICREGAGKANEQIEHDEEDWARALLATALVEHEYPKDQRSEEQVGCEATRGRVCEQGRHKTSRADAFT